MFIKYSIFNNNNVSYEDIIDMQFKFLNVILSFNYPLLFNFN